MSLPPPSASPSPPPRNGTAPPWHAAQDRRAGHRWKPSCGERAQKKPPATQGASWETERLDGWKSKPVFTITIFWYTWEAVTTKNACIKSSGDPKLIVHFVHGISPPQKKKQNSSTPKKTRFRLLTLATNPTGRPKKMTGDSAANSSFVVHLPDSSQAAAASGPCFNSCWVTCLKKQMPGPGSIVREREKTINDKGWKKPKHHRRP